MPTKAAIKRWVIKRRESRRRYLQNLRTNTPCAECGKRFEWYLMDFDHVRGVKSFGMQEAQTCPSISEERFLAEIAKCDIVCCMCHRIREHERGYKGAAAKVSVVTVLPRPAVA